jgi:hypothetical protein
MAMRLPPVSIQSPAASASTRARHVGQSLEVEGSQRLAAGQARLEQMPADAAGLALGDLDLGERGEEAGGGPAVGVSPFGEDGPVPVEARQAQRRQHGGQRMDVDGARGRGRGGGVGGHARISSRASKLVSAVSTTGTSAGSGRCRGERRSFSGRASGR